MVVWYAAGRAAAKANEGHLAIPGVDDPLDRDRALVDRSECLYIPLKAAADGIATLVASGSRPARILHVFDVGIPVGLGRLLQGAFSKACERLVDGFDVRL